jgi:LemA protein
MSTTIVLIVTAVIVIGLLFFFISVYNELSKERILTQEGQSGVGASLQQRNDLIPNLVETVKGYAGHENQTLVDVIKWRNQSAGAATVKDQNVASAGLKESLINMLSLTENYPDLKANAQFQDLMNQLGGIEEKINDSRRYYNGTVREYNQSLAVFPKNIIGGMFGFQAAVFFAEDAGVQVAPQVKFN